MRASVFFDGGSRGNPGPAGCAAVLWIEGDPSPIELKRMIDGDATNNVAEYEGLLLGIRAAIARGVTDLQMVSDSKLVVEQVLGSWKINEPRLKMLCAEARQLGQSFEKAEILHVRREKNKHADKLVTEMLDEATGVKRQ